MRAAQRCRDPRDGAEHIGTHRPVLLEHRDRQPAFQSALKISARPWLKRTMVGDAMRAFVVDVGVLRPRTPCPRSRSTGTRPPASGARTVAQGPQHRVTLADEQEARRASAGPPPRRPNETPMAASTTAPTPVYTKSNALGAEHLDRLVHVALDVLDGLAAVRPPVRDATSSAGPEKSSPVIAAPRAGRATPCRCRCGTGDARRAAGRCRRGAAGRTYHSRQVPRDPPVVVQSYRARGAARDCSSSPG